MLWETPEVVLVAKDYTTALALSSTIDLGQSGCRNRRRNGRSSQCPRAPPFPAVVIGIPGLVDQVQDDVLFLVDASGNFVFPDPDPIYLAQYTAEHDRVAPKHRLYLDEGALSRSNYRWSDSSGIRAHR